MGSDRTAAARPAKEKHECFKNIKNYNVESYKLR